MESVGTFHSTQNSGNFSWYIEWNGPFWFGPTWIFGTSFEGGPLWPVWSFQPVGRKCPSPFDKIMLSPVVLFWILLIKNNNQTRGGLDQVCADVSFHWACEISKISNQNFLLNGKHPVFCYRPVRLMYFTQLFYASENHFWGKQKQLFCSLFPKWLSTDKVKNLQLVPSTC